MPNIIATHHGFCNPDELAYCPALVEVAVFYHDENVWMPEVMCDHILRVAEYLDPRPDTTCNLPLASEIEVELPF